MKNNTKNKVYAVTADYMHTKNFGEAYGLTSQLDAQIQILAKKSGADVHMHQYKTPVEGVPEVLVECDAAFLEKIKKLPLFNALREVNTAQSPTIRRTDAPQIEPPQSMDPPRKNIRPGPDC